MPKLPIKIKPGALPAVTEEVTQGVLDKLPKVNRREIMRGALGALVRAPSLGKAVDIIAPLAKKAVPKIDVLTDFFNIPIIKNFQFKTFKDSLKAEAGIIAPIKKETKHPLATDDFWGDRATNPNDSYSWEYFINRYLPEELDEMGITPENALEKITDDDKLLKNMFEDDVIFHEQSESFLTQELEDFIDGSTKFGDLDKELQDGLKYLISEKKMDLPQIKKLILDPD